ncbi:MAG: hypothetical protein RIT39_1563, partial [Bacteroidota bacterium]
MTTQPLESIRSGTFALIDVRTTDEFQ